MINLRSEADIERMAQAGRLLARCMDRIAESVAPGVTTAELDRIARSFLSAQGAVPSFLGYHGYPAAICTSVNEQVVHGIPGPRKLLPGDIVGVDLGLILNGWQSDMARTFAVGEVSPQAADLIQTTAQCFDAALMQMKPDRHLGDLGWAVQSLAESRGYGVVRSLCGHGIGTQMHEDPEVPNFGPPGRGVRLREGMVLAVEPMINGGTERVSFLDDGWTVVTEDGRLSAHHENTVAITRNGPRILTEDG